MNLRHSMNVALLSSALCPAVLTAPAAWSLEAGAAAPQLTAPELMQTVS
jgi:hypothetical protein